MDAALMLLSYRQRTAREMKQRLRKKGFDEALVSRVIGRLEEIGYIDDRQFALDWIKAHSGAKCRSSWVLKNELRQKGIDPVLADEIVDENYSEEKAFRDACDLAEKKINRISDKNKDKVKNRIQNMFLRRGFSYDFIQRVLAEEMI